MPEVGSILGIADEPAQDVRHDFAETPVEPPTARHEPPRTIYQPQPPRTAPLWGALILLVLILAGAVAWGYWTLRQSNIPVSQIPQMLSSITSLGNRMGSAEAKIQSLTEQWTGLSARMDKFQRHVNVQIRRVRGQAQQMSAQVEQRVMAELNKREAALTARLNQLESAQQADHSRLAAYEQQINDLKQQLSTARQDTSQQLGGLNDRVATTEKNVDDLKEADATHRAEFEARRGQTVNVTDEISVNVTSMDPTYQRFSGWVYYAPDRQFLWVRDHGVEQPVAFYNRDGGDEYELVVTRVEKGLALGYVLLPGSGSAGQQTPASGAGPTGR